MITLKIKLPLILPVNYQNRTTSFMWLNKKQQMVSLSNKKCEIGISLQGHILILSKINPCFFKGPTGFIPAQSVFTCSKSIMETLEQCANSV